MAGKKIGRPRINVDWRAVDEMLQIQCTGEEIAAVVGCSYDTIERACKRENGISFAEYSRQKREGGKSSLRRSQWRKAVEEDNPTMLIWLGKQYLGQKDTQEVAVKPAAPFDGFTIERAKPDPADAD